MTRKGDKQGPSPRRGARHAAIAAGEKFYLPDRPCRRGHIEIRTTSSGTCPVCRRQREFKRYWENPEKYRVVAIQKASNKRPLLAERAAMARATEPPEKRAVRLERARLKSKEWRKNNPRHRTALTTAHKKLVKQRTPKWADMKAIVEIYKKCPPGYHVDHELPLRGKAVSGLHVPENLQYLPAAVNISKSNRYEVQ